MFKPKAIALAVGSLCLMSGCTLLPRDDQAAAGTAVAPAEALYRNGRALQNQGRRAPAAEAYRQAVAIAPRHVEAHNALGVLYAEQALYEQALEELTAAVSAATPGRSHLHNNLGYLHLQHGRLRDAGIEFRQALLLDAANLHAQNNLAALARLQARERALAEAAQSAAVLAAVTGHAALAQRPAIDAAALAPTLQVVAVAPNVWELQARAASPHVIAVPAAASVTPSRTGSTAAANIPPAPAVDIVPVTAAPAVSIVPVTAAPAVSIVPATAGPAVNIAPVPAAAAPASASAATPVALAPGEPVAARVAAAIATAAPSILPLVVAATPIRLRLEISNGNGTTGLAAGVGALLRQHGFARARLTNLLPYQQVLTEIRYVDGYEPLAQQLGATLGIPVRLLAVTQIARQMQVQIVLGKDIGATRVAATARRTGVSDGVQLPPLAQRAITATGVITFKFPASTRAKLRGFM